MQDKILVEAGDSLADVAVQLVEAVQGNPLPEGMSRADLCDAVLAHVSAWWYVATGE